MRRYAWLSFVAIYACSRGSSDPTLYTQPTRVRVSPSAFLGDTPCSESGGMQRYQATLLDVTDGIDEAFALPSSDLVPCTADVEFQYVEAGRYYMAEVRGFDRSDVTAVSKGAPVAVDDSGAPVAARWQTTCWGQDGVTPENFGFGGATDEAAGGVGGEGPTLGVRSFSRTIVTVRGCEALSDAGTDGNTRVSITIADALVDLSCGNGSGAVAEFRQKPLESTGGTPTGGAGGGEGEGPVETATAACDAELLVPATPGGAVSYEIEGLEGTTGTVIWQTTCHARPREGITVSATCDPALGL